MPQLKGLGSTQQLNRSRIKKTALHCKAVFPGGIVCLDASHQQQDDQDQHHEAETSAGSVAPAAAVAPTGQGTNQDEDQDNQQDERKGHKALLVMYALILCPALGATRQEEGVSGSRQALTACAYGLQARRATAWPGDGLA